MKITRTGRLAAVSAIGILALSACGSDNATGSNDSGSKSSGSSVSGTLTGVGASSQSAAMTAWQNGFQQNNSNAHVQYSPDGSGAGRTALLNGGANFAGSDAALKDEEYTKSKNQCGSAGAMDIPVYVSPIAVAFKLDGITSLNLDAPTIAKIFKGQITKWNDDAIKKQNEGVNLPDKAITVVHRSDDSGTTQNFTDYLHAASDGVWDKKADGNWPSGYPGEADKGTSGVVKTTTNNDGAITYADASAIGDLGTVKVKAGDQYIEHSADAAAKAVEEAKRVSGRGEHDISLKLNRTATDGSYPIVLVSYHVVCSQYSSKETADLVKAFETYVVSEDGQNAAKDAAGSAPLPSSLRDEAKKSIDSITSK